MANIKIAISGLSGCGNSTVSNLVASELNLSLINYTFHNMASDVGIEFEEFCKMAQNDPKYDYALDEKQIELASSGNCVLGSRLAIWLLKDATLKVFLTASSDVRVSRIFNREGGTLEAQKEKTTARDKRDCERYKKLYNIDNRDYGFADLIINTDRISARQVADIIINAAKALSE